MKNLKEFIDTLPRKRQSVIEVLRDRSCDMAKVRVNKVCVMEGNLWDFYPGCHGGWHYELKEKYGSWRTPEELSLVLHSAILDATGIYAKFEIGDYKWK